MLHEGDQHYGVGHDDPDKQQDSHHGRKAQAAAGNGQSHKHPDQGQGQAGDDDNRVPQGAKAGHHYEVHQDYPDCHREKDRLEAFGDIGEDPAAGHADARRQGKRGDLQVDLAADRLGVLSGDVTRDARGALAVGAADGDRTLSGDHFGKLVQWGGASWADNYQIAYFFEAADRFAAAGQDHVGGLAVDVDSGHGPADKELAQLEPDLAGGQADRRGSRRVHFYGDLLPDLGRVGFEVDHTVQQSQRRHEFLGHCGDAIIVGARNANLYAGCWRPFGQLGYPDDPFRLRQVFPESTGEVFRGVGRQNHQYARLVESAGHAAETEAGDPDRGGVYIRNAADITLDFYDLFQCAVGRRPRRHGQFDLDHTLAAGWEKGHRNQGQQDQADHGDRHRSS